jgi:hypothetical protein
MDGEGERQNDYECKRYLTANALGRAYCGESAAIAQSGSRSGDCPQLADPPQQIIHARTTGPISQRHYNRVPFAP